MQGMSTDPLTPLVFSADELEWLGRTADALTAWMGKPVLAEVMDGEETGFEWVVFGIPLDLTETPDDDLARVQMGGPGARLLGNRGGVELEAGEVYDCHFLWAIQLCDLEGVRFIKVDSSGDEVAWTDSLHDILPFDASHDPAPAPDDDTPDDNTDPPLPPLNAPGSRHLH